MRPIHAAMFALLATTSVPALAVAQSDSSLTYVQAVAPAGTVVIQDRLRQQGFYNGRADGMWGPGSREALQRFQRAKGLQPTGTLNAATLATLGVNATDILGPQPVAAVVPPAAVMVPVPVVQVPVVAAPVATPLSPTAVRNVQARLRELGFYRGDIDGVWGPSTQAATETFQQGRGLQANGQLNPVTMQAMGLDPNNPAAPARN